MLFYPARRILCMLEKTFSNFFSSNVIKVCIPLISSPFIRIITSANVFNICRKNRITLPPRGVSSASAKVVAQASEHFLQTFSPLCLENISFYH